MAQAAGSEDGTGLGDVANACDYYKSQVTLLVQGI